MRPAPFEYIAPRSPEDAVARLAEYGGEGRLLAGGQSLVPLLNLRMARPAALIDLGRCPDLAYIRRQDGWLAFGPMTRQLDAEHSELVQAHCPLLAKALPYLGPPTTRSRGTVGGTLAHADRLAELPAVAVALGAEITALGPNGSRTIPAAEFFAGDLTTSLAQDEMLREVRFPVDRGETGAGFAEATIRHHDLMLLGVAAHLQFSKGTCMGAQLAVVGGYSVPQRLQKSEALLMGAAVTDAVLAAAARVAGEKIELQDDTYATERYRRRILPALAERAIRQALATRKQHGD